MTTFQKIDSNLRFVPWFLLNFRLALSIDCYELSWCSCCCSVGGTVVSNVSATRTQTWHQNFSNFCNLIFRFVVFFISLFGLSSFCDIRTHTVPCVSVCTSYERIEITFCYEYDWSTMTFLSVRAHTQWRCTKVRREVVCRPPNVWQRVVKVKVAYFSRQHTIIIFF